MRHAIACTVALVALSGCGSSPTKDAAPADKETEALIAQGLKFNEEAKYAESADCFRKAIARDDANVRAHYDLGVALENAKDQKGAVAEYERVLKIDPTIGSAHRQIGEIKLAQGDKQGALAELNKAVDLDAQDASAWVDIGLVDLDDHDNGAAARAFENAAKATPDDSDVAYHLALAHDLAGDAKAARASYERAIELKPTHAQALNNLAILLERAGEGGDRSLELWRSALRASPDFAEAAKNLGAALYLKRGQPYAALAHLERYVSLDGPDQRARTWIAEIRAKTKTTRNGEKAIAVFDRFDGAKLVLADATFELKDAKVADAGKSLRFGDRVSVTFEDGSSARVVAVEAAR